MLKLPKHNKLNDNFVMARWYHRHHQGTKLNAHDKLWPSSEEFYHPWNPTFADFCHSEEALDLYPTLLLRDGAQSLLDFFLRFPEPGKSKTQVLVHADLSCLVPMAWKEQTKYYRLENSKPNTVTSQLLIYHLLNETPFDRETYSQQLQRFLSQFSNDSEVSLYLGLRDSLYPKQWSERRDFLDLISEFQFYFKKKINILNLDDFKRMAAMPTMTYVNFDFYKASIALCSIDSYMMSSDCQMYPVLQDKAFKGELVGKSPLSFKHEIALYDFKNTHDDFEYLFKLKKISKEGGCMPFPVLPALMEVLSKRLQS